MVNLDKINFKKQDPEGMIEKIDNFNVICHKAWQLADGINIPPYYIKAKRIVIIGMGASGVCGDILKDLIRDKDLIIESIHDYSIPKWVDKDTVVVAISYSGNTEETLDAFTEAYKIGAKLFAITSGGKLADLAAKYKSPVYKFDYTSPSRAAFPFMFVPLLSIFMKLGHLDVIDFEGIVNNIEQFQEKFKTSVRTINNPAKTLARRIYGKTAIVYSSGTLKSVGIRMKTQLNENAKNFSFVEFLPELNHNSVEGYKTPRNSSFVVMLESNFDNTKIIKRQNITASLLSKNNISFDRIKFVSCHDPLTEALCMIVFVDYVSYYLSILNGSDSGTVKNIEYLKSELVT